MIYYILDTMNGLWLGKDVVDKEIIQSDTSYANEDGYIAGWVQNIENATEFNKEDAFRIFLKSVKDGDSLAAVRQEDIILAKMGLPS